MSSNNDNYRNRQVSNYLYHKRNTNNSNTDIVKAALIRFVTKAHPPNTIPNEKQIERGYRTAQTQIIRDGQIPRGIYEKDVESFPLNNARPPEPVPFNYPFELLQIHASGNPLITRDGHTYESRVVGRNNANTVANAMTFITDMMSSTGSLSQLLKTLRSGNSRLKQFSLDYTPTNPQTTNPQTHTVHFRYLFKFDQNQFEYTFEEGNLVILYRYCEDQKFFPAIKAPYYFKYPFSLPGKLRTIVSSLNRRSQKTETLPFQWFEDSNNNELHLNLGKCIDSYFNINNRSKMTAAFKSARYPERLYDEAQFKKEMAQLRQKSLFRRNDTDTLLERNKHERVLKFLRKVQEVFEDLGANGQLGNSQMIKKIPVHLSTYARNAKLLELKTPFIAASGEIKKVLEEREKLVNKLRNTNFMSSNNKAKILQTIKNIK